MQLFSNLSSEATSLSSEATSLRHAALLSHGTLETGLDFPLGWDRAR